MIEWIMFAVGIGVGFGVAVLSLIVYGRKQISSALKQLKGEKD